MSNPIMKPLPDGEVSLIYYRNGDALPVALSKEQHEKLQIFIRAIHPIRAVTQIKYSVEKND